MSNWALAVVLEFDSVYFQDLYLSTRRWRPRCRNGCRTSRQSDTWKRWVLWQRVVYCRLTSDNAVPLIVVFTKYDILVTSEIWKSSGGGSTEQDWLEGEEKATKTFNELCVGPLTGAIGEVPMKGVSGGWRLSLELVEQLTLPLTHLQVGRDIQVRLRN